MKKIIGLLLIFTLLSLTGCTPNQVRELNKDNTKSDGELHTETSDAVIEKVFTCSGDISGYELLVYVDTELISGYIIVNIDRSYFWAAKPGDHIKVYYEYYTYGDGTCGYAFSTKCVSADFQPIDLNLKLKSK